MLTNDSDTGKGVAAGGGKRARTDGSHRMDNATRKQNPSGTAFTTLTVMRMDAFCQLLLASSLSLFPHCRGLQLGFAHLGSLIAAHLWLSKPCHRTVLVRARLTTAAREGTLSMNVLSTASVANDDLPRIDSRRTSTCPAHPLGIALSEMLARSDELRYQRDA